MTQWRLSANPGFQTLDGSDGYCPLISGGGSTTEADTQCKFYTAFTCTDLRTFSNNAFSVTVTITLRDDGVDQTDQQTSTTLTAAWVEDLTGSVTPAANSLMSLRCDNGGMHGDSVNFTWNMLTIEHASVDAPIVPGGYYYSGSTNLYGPIGPGGRPNIASDAAARVTIRRSQSFSNLRAYCVSITGTSSTLRPMKNGTDSTNVSISMTASATAYEDITGSEACAAADTLSMHVTNSSVSAISVNQIQMDANTAESWCSAFTGSAPGSGVRWYSGPIVDTWGMWDDTRQDFKWRAGSASASNLETYVTDAGSGTRDISLVVGSTVSSNVTISVTATGHLEDVTGSESVGDADHIGFSAYSSSTAVYFNFVAVELPWSSAGGTFYQTVTGAVAAAGTVAKQGGKAVAGAVGAAGTLAKLAAHGVLGAIGAAGSVAKMPATTILGAVGAAGVVNTSKVALQSIVGAMGAAGTLVKEPQVIVLGAVSIAGAVTKLVSSSVIGAIGAAGTVAKLPQITVLGSVGAAGTVAAIKAVLLSITGAVGAAGALANTPVKAVVGTVSAAGTLARQPDKLVSGAIGVAGILTRQPIKLVQGAVSVSGTALVFFVDKTIAGAITATGTVTKFVQTSVTGTIGLAGTITKTALKPITGAVSAAGTASATKVAIQLITGAVSAAGVVTKVPGVVVIGTISASGTMVKVPGKLVTGAVSAAGTVTNQIWKTVQGAVSASGVLDAQKLVGTFFQDIFGAVGAAGTLTRQPQKAVSGAMGVAGVVSRLVGKGITGAVAVAGTVVSIRVAVLLVTGAVGAAGTLVRQAGKGVTGTIGVAGSLTKLVSTSITGAMGAAGTVTSIKTVVLAITGAVAASGVLAKQAGKSVLGSVGVAGSITQKFVSKVIQGAVGVGGFVWTVGGVVFTRPFPPNIRARVPDRPGGPKTTKGPKPE